MKKFYSLLLIYLLGLPIIWAQSNPSLSITKDDALPYTAQNLADGDVISYTLTVTNTGNVTLTQIEIVDSDTANNATQTIASLPAGQSVNLNAIGAVTQADIDTGYVSSYSIANFTYNGQSYSIHSDDADASAPANPDDPTLTFIVQTPGLALFLDDQLSGQILNVNIGDPIDYILSVANVGNVTLYNISINLDNAVPNNTSIPALAPGEVEVVYDVAHTITQGDLDAGYVSCQGFGEIQWNGQSLIFISDGDGTNYTPEEPTITYVQLVSINDYLTNKLNVYPSLATDFIHITTNEHIQIQSASIYNLEGKVLQKNSLLRKHSIRVSQLPAGHYFVVIHTDKGNAVKKFMVE